jgi:alpha-mannosidase
MAHSGRFFAIFVVFSFVRAFAGEIEIHCQAVTASSCDRDGSLDEPWFALDGDRGTEWCSQKGDPAWLEVDLGAVHRLKEVVILHAGHSSRDQGAWQLNLTDFELLGGETREALASLGKTAANPATEAAGTTTIAGNGTPARYLRLAVAKTPDGHARVTDIIVTVLDAQGAEARVRATVILTPEEKKNLRIDVIPQSHIDVAWLWRYDPETIDDCARETFGRAVDLLGANPAYSFTASQVPLFEPLEDRYPDLWKKIVALVKAGRFEIAGGSYVEFEGAGPCGESLVRQFVHGKRFFREKFGVDVTTAWQPDAWTHPATLPQILALAGVDTYFFQRGAPRDAFVWEGIDGTRVLAIAPITDSEPPAVLSRAARAFREQGRSTTVVLMGGGDHGGGPDAAEVEAAQSSMAAAGVQAAFSGAARAAADVRRDIERLPTVRGELGFQFPGSYTTLGKIKGGNRTSENLLLVTERLAAVAARYQPYPAETLRTAWSYVLFNQFHDIMAGCVVPAAYEDALTLYNRIDDLVKPALDQVLQGLLMHIDTRGIPNAVVVFNPLGWQRAGAVLIPAPPAEGTWIARDDEGRLAPTQVVFDPQTGEKKLLFVAAAVPSFGYRTFSLVPAPEEFKNPLSAARGTLASSAFAITFAEGSGDIAGIAAKGLDWQVLAGPGNQIHVLEDLGDSEGRLDFSGRSWMLGPFIDMDVIESGPVRAGIRVRNKLPGEHTTFVREVYVTEGLPWVEFRTYIEWNGEKKFAKVAFPVAVEAEQSTWELPYGVVDRPNDGLERPALQWVDMSDGTHGASLINLNRGGYDVRSKLIRLSVLRSPTWPAHNDEGGNLVVPYALYPHAGSWRAGDVYQRAFEFNVPLIAVPTAERGGALPARASFFSVDPDRILIGAVKAAEDSNGLVVRLVEMEGQPAEATLRSHWFLRSAFETNLLEQGGKELLSSGDKIKLSFRPFEIKTIVLRNWGYAPLR